jgi:prepilin-type processing-associated H-X9-DG protein
MPIPFSCPHCGHSSTVADQYAGQSGPCSACGQTITIPGSATPPPQQPAHQNYPTGRQPRKSSNSAPIIIICVVVAIVLCSGILVALLIPAIHSVRESVELSRGAARRMQCSNNMKQLGLAMHNYHDCYNSIPAAVGPMEPGYSEIPLNGADDEDAPNDWTWRVRILPFTENSYTYEQFNFNEPWDSDHNLMIAMNMPDTYRCSSDTQDYKEVNGYMIPVTNYVMVTGPDAIGRNDDDAIRFANVTDGLSNTIIFVEVAGDNRPAWTEPVDITIEDLQQGINSGAIGSVGSMHPGGFNACFCDGSVHFLQDSIDSETLRRLGQINDGHAVSW